MWDLGRPTLRRPLLFFRRQEEGGGVPYFLMKEKGGTASYLSVGSHGEKRGGMEINRHMGGYELVKSYFK